MVFAQLKTNGVIDKSILNIFENTAREYFVPLVSLPIAYGDSPIYCEVPGRYILAPQTLGILLQHLSLSPNDKVLVVGGNYGYTATLLFELKCMAYIVESNPILVSKCRDRLKKYNPIIQNTSLGLGLEEYGPYKAIIIELGLSSIPDFVIHQLEENGKLAVCLTAAENSLTKACIFEKKANKLQEVFTIKANMPLCTELIGPENFTF
jgi:protein-L-isoaspartate(D-aspartate) O-methyltransferase